MNSLDILDRLIAFPSVSRDPNLPLIEYVQAFLAARGVTAKLYRDPSGKKANLYASIGPVDRGGVLLSGHTDVVPVDGQAWRSEPFRLHDGGDRVFARGAADMKGFIACALRAADRAATRTLATPLQLAFSYDEEIGCVGVRSLIEDMRTWAHRPRLCIVGEPTMLRTAVGHKGRLGFRATCRGRASHSARPDRGVNAIYMACDFVARVRARQATIIEAGARDDSYEVPYTTLLASVIHGGTVSNIIPAHCELDLEIRHLVDDDPAALAAALRADAHAVGRMSSEHADVGIDLELMNEYPGLETPAHSEVVAFAAALTGHRECVKVSFGTEGGLFSGQLGIPTVVCGPGSIEAHKPDEFLHKDQLERCDAVMDALIERLST
jgi:acetylornithine deacetylase